MGRLIRMVEVKSVREKGRLGETFRLGRCKTARTCRHVTQALRIQPTMH